MAEELKKLVKICGGHRASLTKTLAVTEELLTVYDKIILLVEDRNIEDEVASADDICQAIQRAIVHIDLILEKLKKKNGIKMVDLHHRISKVRYDKFNYLNSLLEKSAAEAISGLKITSANYQEAIDILDKRFGNQQQIVNAHMNALLNLPKVTNVDDLKALRQLHDKVESHMRGLKSLEVDSGSYGSLLTPILIDKLPKELRLEATKQLKEDWDLDELIKIFKRGTGGSREGKSLTLQFKGSPI
ncbi:PREDICTED: uncharacterized protein LOC105315219 [Paramuricea clavata]|uniref:PREDICTED: uncharacterized protein LOC105315219 n=1 Tax=Paramuricea clavata TaxID=317549 RepID=A0A6S7HL20_PARCT|nr:PREDICTED: uncharacterized protein LOC105315219 [Paramuricea clavata]